MAAYIKSNIMSKVLLSKALCPKLVVSAKQAELLQLDEALDDEFEAMRIAHEWDERQRVKTDKMRALYWDKIVPLRAEIAKIEEENNLGRIKYWGGKPILAAQFSFEEHLFLGLNPYSRWVES